MKDYTHIEHMRNLNDWLIWERMKRCYDYGYEDGQKSEQKPWNDVEDITNDELVEKIPDEATRLMVKVFGKFGDWEKITVAEILKALEKG